MSYGLSTRTVASPLGVKQRFAKGVKYVPLSQFFLRKQKEGEDGEEAVYGVKEPEKKGEPPKTKKRRQRAAESVSEGCRYSPQRCMYCDAGASRALVYAGGRGYIPCCRKHINKGSMRIWRRLKDKIVARRRIPKKHKLKEGQSVAQDENLSGMTSTATVATTPVPIGPGIRHVTDILDFGKGHPFHNKKKRRKKKKSPWAAKIGKLLRRVV